MRFSAKKSSKIKSKLDLNSNASSAPKSAIRHSWSADQHMASVDRHSPSANQNLLSADWPKLVAQSGDPLIGIKPIFFEILEIRTHSNSYLISFLSILTSINRGEKSELRALLFWLLNSLYVKDMDPRGWFISIFDTSTLHLPLVHVSSPISETIHVSPLTTIKKNKIVSLLFNVGLNIFTTPHLPYSLPHFTFML